MLQGNGSKLAPEILSHDPVNSPNRLTQCCTQFKSLGVKILCVFYLHYNVAFTFTWYGNSWEKKTFYSQRVWIGHNIELTNLVYSWFSLTWCDGHVGLQNNGKMSLKFCIIIESNSQRTFFAIVLHTNMAAVTSRENWELAGKMKKWWNDAECTRAWNDVTIITIVTIAGKS